MIIWATLLFGLLTVATIFFMVADEVRVRLTRPGRPGPLAGISKGDAVVIALYVLPIILATYGAIRTVLT